MKEETTLSGSHDHSSLAPSHSQRGGQATLAQLVHQRTVIFHLSEISAGCFTACSASETSFHFALTFCDLQIHTHRFQLIQRKIFRFFQDST